MNISPSRTGAPAFSAKLEAMHPIHTVVQRTEISQLANQNLRFAFLQTLLQTLQISCCSVSLPNSSKMPLIIGGRERRCNNALIQRLKPRRIPAIARAKKALPLKRGGQECIRWISQLHSGVSLLNT
jgi:hypothetical protein